MFHARLAATLALAAFIGMPASAAMPPQDTVKGQDHPLLTRYAGARLVGYETKAFEEVVLPSGKRSVDKEGKSRLEATITLEGKYTRLVYVYAGDRSSLEVMRNHETALQQAGFVTLFACAKETCGRDFGEGVLSGNEGKLIQGGGDAYSPFNYGRLEPRYLLAKGTRPDGSTVHAAVYIVPPVEDKNGGVYLRILEGKPMETAKVSANLNAADMARGLSAEGRVALYGVYFDTGRADVQPASKPSIEEMAKLLQQTPALKVHIVGHTDNQGTLAQNTELSQKRAEAIVKLLVGDYKVDARRLSAKGVGPYAPVASNDAEPGRARNRRVELVKQ